VTNSDRPIGEDDIQASIDGRLAPDRVAKLEAYLRNHREVADRIAASRRLRHELKDAFAARGEQPVPARLRVSTIVVDRRLGALRKLRAVAVAAFWLALGSAIGWFANGALGRDVLMPGLSTHLSAMTRDAVSAHRTFTVEVAHPVEVRADQMTHLARWIEKRLGHDLVIPDLTASGLYLMGGRVLPAEQGTAAQLMYEDEHGMRVTLYVRAGESGETAFRFLRHGDVLTFYWIDDGCGYVVSAATDRDRLLAIAEHVFHQLEDTGRSRKPTL
jgi:anti-sigma factor RsiW